MIRLFQYEKSYSEVELIKFSKMKFAIFCFVIFTVILFAHANQGSNQDQFMTESELTELITDYRDL